MSSIIDYPNAAICTVLLVALILWAAVVLENIVKRSARRAVCFVTVGDDGAQQR